MRGKMAERVPKSVLFVCLGETALLAWRVGWASCAAGCALGRRR